MSVATIRAADLSLLLCAARLRRFTNGRTCQLCALSPAPAIPVDCHERWSRAAGQAGAKRVGLSRMCASPMQRGLIARLYERVNREHGRKEVLRTWGAGIRTLRAEPAHVLNGGSDA